MSETLNVTLGQYKGLKMKSRPVTVSDAEVEQAFQQQLASMATDREVTDRPVAMGDKINLNFAGFQDGVQFQGGTAEGYELVIGSHSFIDTFEEQLVGTEIGQEVTVNVTFPENYGSAELAGKPAKFICVVNKIYEKVDPVFDDEFVKANTTCQTVDEFKEKIREQILSQKTEQMNTSRVQVLVQRVVADSQVEAPEEAVKKVVSEYINGFANQLMQQGMQLEQYCQMSGMTVEDMENQIYPEAEMRVKMQMVLSKIAEIENIVVEDEEVQKRLYSFAEMYGMDAGELMSSLGEPEINNLKEEILLNRAMEVIVENVIDEAE